MWTGRIRRLSLPTTLLRITVAPVRSVGGIKRLLLSLTPLWPIPPGGTGAGEVRWLLLFLPRKEGGTVAGGVRWLLLLLPLLVPLLLRSLSVAGLVPCSFGPSPQFGSRCVLAWGGLSLRLVPAAFPVCA